MNSLKWWFISEKKSDVDWRRLGCDVWNEISEWLGYVERIVIWKYFGLARPMMPFLHLHILARRADIVKQKIIDETEVFIKESKLNEEDAHEVRGQMSLFEIIKDDRDSLLKKWFDENGIIYLCSDFAGNIDCVIKLISKYKISLQCHRCKKFNRMKYTTTKNYTGANMYNFYALREFNPGHNLFYIDHLCPCRINKKGNEMKVVQLDSGYLVQYLKDFYRV